MAGFDENIVREYFELNGFFVRQLRKYLVQSRKKRVDEEIDLVVYNPIAPIDGVPAGFQLFSADMAKIRRAIVVVKAWHTSRFTPAMLKSSSRVFDFLKKEVLNKAATYFSFDEGEVDREVVGLAEFTKILVLPSHPFEEADPTGIFQALIRYTKPSVEKNNTEVCVFTERV